MNDYKVCFTRTNGTTGESNITAATYNDAKRDFKKLHCAIDVSEITSLELVREDVYATKQQERDAIVQISEIIKTLGENSYVGTAMKGVLEIAECNIENDFGDSPFDNWKSATLELDTLKRDIKKAETDLANIPSLKSRISELEELQRTLTDEARLENCRANSAEENCRELAQEIITLKAKLYDLLITQS